MLEYDEMKLLIRIYDFLFVLLSFAVKLRTPKSTAKKFRKNAVFFYTETCNGRRFAPTELEFIGPLLPPTDV